MNRYRPLRLAQISPAAGIETVAYTVPGGQLAIVKQAMVANTAAVGLDVSLSLAGSRLVNAVTVPAKSVLVFDLSQVVNSGETITVLSTGAGASFTVSGVETAATELPDTGLEVWLDGVSRGTWPRIHFHEGAGVTITVEEDQANNETDVTLAVAGLAATMSYVHNQSVATDVWVINHNLGFYPNAVVIDSSGAVVEGDSTYPTVNQMQVAFAAAISGVAYLS